MAAQPYTDDLSQLNLSTIFVLNHVDHVIAPHITSRVSGASPHAASAPCCKTHTLLNAAPRPGTTAQRRITTCGTFITAASSLILKRGILHNATLCGAQPHPQRAAGAHRDGRI